MRVDKELFTMSTVEQDQQIISKHLSQLGEHFNNVQILVSTPDSINTRHIFGGCGDWFSRLGMCHAFIKSDENQDLAYSLSEFLEE